MNKLKSFLAYLLFIAWLGSFSYGAVYNWGGGDYSGGYLDSRPSGTIRDGVRYYEKQANGSVRIYVMSSGSWTLVSSGETGTIITAHGDLTGLGADDHPQYLLLTGISGTGVMYRTGGSVSVVSAGTPTSCVWALDESGELGCYAGLIISMDSLTGQGDGLQAYSAGAWTSISTTYYSASTHTHATSSEATYTANALTVTNGTLTAGTVADLATIGSGTVQIVETTGASPILATVELTGVGTINNVLVRGYYSGGASHDVVIEIYNNNTATYEVLGQMPTASAHAWYSYTLFVSTDYVSSGTSTIRFRHVQNGVATHNLYLDYVVVRNSFGGGGGVQSHSSLSGLDHPDHPFSAITGSISSAQLPEPYSNTSHTHSISGVKKTITFGFVGGGSVLSATTDTLGLMSYESGTITQYNLVCSPTGTVSINVYAKDNSIPSSSDLVTTISIANSTITSSTNLSSFTTTTTADGKVWVGKVTGTPSGSKACSLILRYLSGD